MILKMTDNTTMYVTKEQADRIEHSISIGNEVVILPNSTMLKTKNILSILPGSDPATIDASHIIAEGKRRATDEGIRAARVRLDEKLRAVREKREREYLQHRLSQPIAHNVPKIFDKKKGSVPGWDELYGN